MVQECNYNFDEIVERRGTGCLKWDSGNEDVLSMWVADMDFKVAPPILEGLHARVNHGIFGYSIATKEYHDSAIGWFSRRYGWEIQREWFSHTPGIVSALHFTCQMLEKGQDKVIMLSPVYYPFFQSCERNGIGVISSEMKVIDGQYEIDFDDFAAKAAMENVRAFFLCNPHNPGGRVWSREELLRLADICIQNDLLIVSDEIHCDIGIGGYTHHPVAGLSKEIAQHCIVFVAPSKTFNLAGMQTSFAVIPNPDIKARFDACVARSGISRPNAMGIAALTAAYNEGEPWLEALLDYLRGNLEYLCSFFKENLPECWVMKPMAGYLVWFNFSGLHVDSREFHRRLLEEGKLWLDEGYLFGPPGEGFERINIACPRAILQDGLERMRKVVHGIRVQQAVKGES